jgi:hypothetical protein
MRKLFVVAAVVLLTACGSVRQQSAQQRVEVAPCDTVTATGTSYGRHQARRHAEQNLRHQLPDARGDLVSAGLRRVRTVGKRTTCKPYSLFGGATSLTTCTIQARVCGR